MMEILAVVGPFRFLSVQIDLNIPAAYNALEVLT